MRIRFRHRLTTLLLLPLLVGFGIKWCRGPHEYSLLGEHVQRVTEAEARDPSARYTVYQIRAVSYRAYRNLDGNRTRHGPEICYGLGGDKQTMDTATGCDMAYTAISVRVVSF
jgi:hypothetical protein